MANADEARAYRNGQTGNPNTSSNNGKTDWQKQLEMLSLASLARGASPATMAGFALGKYLSNMMARREAKKTSENDLLKLKELEGGGTSTESTGTNGDNSSQGYGVGVQFEGLYDPWYMKDHDMSHPNEITSITFNRGENGGSVVDGTTPYNTGRDNGYSELANYMRSKDGDYNIETGLAQLVNGNDGDLSVLGNRGTLGYNVGTGKMEYIPLSTGLLNVNGIKYRK